MSTNPALPSLSEWTKTHIIDIYDLNSPAGAEAALAAFVSKNADITVNFEKIQFSDLANGLQTVKVQQDAGIVDFPFINEVPANKAAPEKVIGLYSRSNFE